MRANYFSLFLGILLFTCGNLTACGTKGPLYIPEQRYPQAATAKPNSAPKVESTSSSDTQHTGQ